MADITIAVRDDEGTLRRVTKIMPMADGFAVSVPYHSAMRGWLFKMPADYARTNNVVPVSEMTSYTAEDRVKLSFHLNGFVQFSRGGKGPILSGYDEARGEVKGLGLKAPDPVDVTSGPLFAIVVRGLTDFESLGERKAVVFEKEDFWRHPRDSSVTAKSHLLEAFMFPTSLLREVREIDGKPILRKQLPFLSLLEFRHELRVIELPNLPVFLGMIVSRCTTSADDPSGFTLSGPGCGMPGETKMSISAWYPRPDFIKDASSLEYPTPSEPNKPRG